MSNKIRVVNSTAKDDDKDILINRISSNFFFIYCFIFIAIINHLYWLAFALFTFSLSFKIQIQIAKNQRKAEMLENLNLINGDNIQNKYSIHVGTLVNKHYKTFYKVKNFYNYIKKSLSLKFDAPKIESFVITGSKSNAIAPALINDSMLREHITVCGTTGSGKTQFLMNSLIESTVARGGGLLAVAGKANNKVLQIIQAITVKYNRQMDLLLYDFTENKEGKTNTNRINFFEGSSRDIIATLTSIGNFETGFWGDLSKTLLSDYLRFILILRDADFFPDVEKLEDIYNADDKFAIYQKNTKTLDFFGFNRLLTSFDLMIKMLLIFDDFYENNRTELNLKLYKKYRNIIEKEEENNTSVAHLDKSEKNEVHLDLKMTVCKPTKLEWKTIKDRYFIGIEIAENEFIKGVEALNVGAGSSERTSKYTEAINGMQNVFTFFNDFPSIFKNHASNCIPLIDAIDSNRIIVFNIPGQNKLYAPVIANMIISSLEILLERRAKDYESDVTSLALLDEINSWLKTRSNGKGGGVDSFNLGNILSVIRDLNIGAVLSFQSSLKETLGSVDASMVFSNTNTDIVLKLKDSDLIESLNKKVAKVKKLELEENQHKAYNSKNRNQPSTEELKYTKSEEDFFKTEDLSKAENGDSYIIKDGDLSKIENGQGYIIRSGGVQKILCKYTNQPELYKSKEEEVLLNRFISLEELKKELKC